MYTLALETSTQLGSVCIFENDRLLAQKTSTHQKSHSDFVNLAIEEVLRDCSLRIEQVDLFASGLGPGSFTGIRIAVNVAKSFSYLLQKPVVAIDSLTLLAHQVPAPSRLIMALINAYKNMNYTAIYDPTKSLERPLRPIAAVPVKDLDDWLAEDPKTKSLESFDVVGDGFATYSQHFPQPLIPRLHRKDGTHDYPEGKTLGALAFRLYQAGQTMDWKSLMPLYIRASEAEENKRGLIFSPLK